ncbi:hypothetical protein [Nonlabens ponticola]|uniref:Uncharacterized protein n=1 Tax=Nonlabens ponticola TaxID=2496866 RepID=A0A3S9N055_9FLAO|nr:hypothetical protein [Nonlabens ponticola]AZQ44768.1 hypothetical protein EJ995_11180 [Nonlabens ponticola]
MTSARYRGFALTGVVLIVIAVACWILDAPEQWAYIAAGLAVAAFTSLSLDSFTSANAISYSDKSATFKLLGQKSVGFTFSDVQEFELKEQGLLLKVQGLDVMKLSRKRYTDQSLKQLNTLLQDKTSKHE